MLPRSYGGKQMSADLASGFRPAVLQPWWCLSPTAEHLKNPAERTSPWLWQAQIPKEERYLHRYIKIPGNRIDEEMSDALVVKTECELVLHFQAGMERHTVVDVAGAFVSLTSTSKVFCCSETCRAISFISTFLSLVLQTKVFIINQCLQVSLYHSKKYYSAPRSCTDYV